MTKYREILRLRSLGLSQNDIASSCHVSKKTVNRVLKLAQEHNLRWPLEESLTDREIDKIIHPDGNTAKKTTNKKMPDFEHVKNELLRNGVNKKLLWAEYLEECRLQGAKPLMYSQFCHCILQDERVRRATMHINRKPGEQIEVDWAGDPAYIIDSETGEQKKACLSNTTKSPSKRRRAAEKDCSTWKRERSSCRCPGRATKTPFGAVSRSSSITTSALMATSIRSRSVSSARKSMYGKPTRSSRFSTMETGLHPTQDCLAVKENIVHRQSTCRKSIKSSLNGMETDSVVGLARLATVR